MAVRILVGDARDMLATLPAGSVQCTVCSPPYFGLRSYLPDGHADKAAEIGLEQSPDQYVASLVSVFAEVRRVLSDDGVLWLVIGDSYSNSGKWGGATSGKHAKALHGKPQSTGQIKRDWSGTGIKPKDLLMIPARVALALQADGWYLRSHCVWAKPNPMPESVRDRPTSAHESVFLLTKRAKYTYHADAVAEPASQPPPRFDWQERRARGEAVRRGDPSQSGPQRHSGGVGGNGMTRNLRNVWNIIPRNFPGAHFATFPPELARRCILAGSKPGDTILDPFFGAGTTGLVAQELGRHCVGVELNPAYADLACERLGLPAIPQLEAAD